MQSQLSKLPVEQRALVEKIINEKPELLMQLANDIQTLLKSGMSQEQAMIEIAKKYEGDLKGLLGK